MSPTRALAASWLVGSLLLPAPARPEPVAATLVPLGATWSYLDDGSDRGVGWRAPLFADGGWASGAAELGYGDGDEVTVVASGPPGNYFITTYFRHHFSVVDAVSIAALTLSIRRDDGAVVYLNGTEVVRSNLPGGSIDYLTGASAAVGGIDFHEFAVDPSALVDGDNVLAVEIHQVNGSSSDISLDLELVTAPEAGALARAPYLQVGTPDSVVVRWRTSAAEPSTVRYGPAPGDLPNSVTITGSRLDHEVLLSGLPTSARTYYAVGTPSETFAGADADHFVETPPEPGARQPLRTWVIGDSGQCAFSAQGCTDAAAVRDAYLGFAGANLAQSWLLLGDNAYGSGTDSQYTAGFFDVYPEVSRNTLLWPAPGNHEFGASDSPSETGPYYEAFSMPTAGEAGGVASGTEAYYSFDLANVHFVSIDSHDTDRSAPPNPETNVCAAGQGGAMYQWLCADLAATNQDFIIVFWHHPPYSRGSHDSDDCSINPRMCEIRERFLPVIEEFGVDLQLTGHSHSYERSYLIDGNYGLSSECSAGQCFLDGGDGDPDPGGDGAYQKANLGPWPHEGTVYSVVGSSSKVTSASLDHPVMAVSLATLGSLVIDVVGRQLDATWIDASGAPVDHFRILKGSPLPVCDNGLDDDGDGFIDFRSDASGDPGCFDALGAAEDPQCQDGIDNDGQTGTDFDGGVSVLGAAGADPNGPDPNCTSAWVGMEANTTAGSCGLGVELAIGLPLLRLARRRRRQPR